MTLRRSCALQMLSLATSAAKLVLLSTFLVTIHCYALSSIESSTFHGRTLVTETVHRSKSASCSSCNRIGSYLVMRKQKASDRRTRRRQRGEELDQQQVESNISVLTKPRTITSSPMAEASWNHKQPLQKCRSQPVRPASTKKGRGRSRKRSALYSLLSFYNNKFLDLLTAEYQVEEEEVLGRIKASMDDPLALETAGYALFDLYPERRGNLFSDEVYRLTKAKDATTTYPANAEKISGDDENHDVRYLPSNHKFSKNDVIMLTLQPSGSGDFFQPESVPTSDSAVTLEARVLDCGPTYVDVALSAGSFETTFGSPAPNDKSGKGDKTLRLRADRFVSNIPYQRMVAAVYQMTRIPDHSENSGSNTLDGTASDDTEENPHERICMDQTIREAILSTHAFCDPQSPLLDEPGICNLQELSRRLSKPPMTTSPRLAAQILKFLKDNPNGIFREFNSPQRAAIEASLTRRMTMIQGPPGSGKTTVASAVGFGFVFQCRSISPHAKVLACAYSNVGADNLAESLQALGLKIVRVGKPSAIAESLWDCTLDAAIDRDPDAQKALKNAVRATTQLQKMTRNMGQGRTGNSGANTERNMRDIATAAVKASIEACNIAVTKALREADVVVSTSIGAADPRILAACGISTEEKDSMFGGSTSKSGASASTRVDAPDGLPPLSFPFVIIDEACQSVEPASLIPVVSTNSCRSLVMLGDPCQLPPTVRSGQLSPLSVSLMERLAATLPHPTTIPRADTTAFDNTYLDTLPVKQAKSLLRSRPHERQQSSSYRKRFPGSLLLSIQFRMHPSIAALPSELFYNGLLSTPSFMASSRMFPRALKNRMPSADPNMCVRLIDVGGRTNENRGMPHTPFGSTLNSVEEKTSYWNKPEVHRVISLIKDVLNDPDPALTSIGVVTPYNGQVQLIKDMMADDSDLKALLDRKPTTIEVKSVDGYQGRERDVIIFSAVRSNRQGAIGFLTDWRRLNVALTRAKSALVVVGDFATLESDPHWAALYKWGCGVQCVVNGSGPEEPRSV